MKKTFVAVLALLCLLGASPALAAEATVAASSTAASLFMGFSPENLLDDDPATAWAEGGEGVGAGQWVEFSFAGPQKLFRLHVRNGVQDPTWFEKYNRVKTLDLVFSDGTRRRVELADSQDEQAVDLGGVTSSWLRLVLVDVYKCSLFFNSKTTCLGGVRIETADQAGATSAEGPATQALAQALQAESDDRPKAEAKPVLQTAPAPAVQPTKGKPAADRAGAELLREFRAGSEAVLVIQEFYRRLTTLDDSFPDLFVRSAREQETFIFEIFREYQRKRKTYEKFRNALLELDKLEMRFQIIDPDRVRVEVAGTYTIYVADTYEDVPENTLFILLREEGKWRILERQDGMAQARK